MFKKSIIQKTLGAVLALFLSVGSVSTSWASAYWRGGGDLTAIAAEKAKEAAAAAVAVAAAWVARETAALATAQRALTAARAAAFGIPAAAAAVAKATAAVAAAEAALAAATAAAADLALGVGVLAAGTLVGQGIDYFIDWCWDPVCDLTALNTNGPIYNGPATDEEINRLIPEMLSIVGVQNLIVSDLDPQSYQFLSQEIRMGLGFTRGAAAYTAGRSDEVARALKDLQQELNTFPDTIKNFVEAYQGKTFHSPVPELVRAYDDFSAAIEEARLALMNERSKPGADTAKIDEALQELASANGHFQQVREDASTFEDLPLVGPDGAFPSLTLDDYKQFMSDCATKGKDCLPSEEIALVKSLVEAAGVYSPSTPDGDFGDKIAEWDAFFHDNSLDYPLFDTDGLTPLEVLSNSATVKSDNGSWLGIDLNESPLMEWLRGLDTQIPGTGGCSLIKGI